MSTPPRETSGKGIGSRRPLVGAAVLALVLGLIGVAAWLLGGEDATGSQGSASSVVASQPRVGDEAARLPSAAPEHGDRAPDDTLPAATPAEVAALAAGADATADWREIRGLAVRAADDSPVASATVISLQREGAAGTMAERSRARTDAEGRFTLRLPRDIDGFRVLAPVAGRSAGGAAQGSEVTARTEWENGDPAATAVRLVLETGWRMDFYVLDAAGDPRAGAVVRCGSHVATSDAEGRCTLLDLPVGGAQVTLSVQSAAGGPRTTHVMPAPEAGSLRGGGKLTVP